MAASYSFATFTVKPRSARRLRAPRGRCVA